MKKKRIRLRSDLSKVIVNDLGGTSKVAEMCGLAPSTVSEWKSEGLPKAWVLYLRERFKDKLPVMEHPEVKNF